MRSCSQSESGIHREDPPTQITVGVEADGSRADGLGSEEEGEEKMREQRRQNFFCESERWLGWLADGDRVAWFAARYTTSIWHTSFGMSGDGDVILVCEEI